MLLLALVGAVHSDSDFDAARIRLYEPILSKVQGGNCLTTVVRLDVVEDDRTWRLLRHRHSCFADRPHTHCFVLIALSSVDYLFSMYIIANPIES